jgi:hypothetical protein
MRTKLPALLALAMLTTLAAEPSFAKNWKNSSPSNCNTANSNWNAGHSDCRNNGSGWNHSASTWNNGRPGWNTRRPDWNRHLYNRNSGGNRWDIDSRQANINTQIQRGITSGRLSPSEVERLSRMQTNLDQLESQYRSSDSRLSMSERAKLSARMNKLSSVLRKELWDR